MNKSKVSTKGVPKTFINDRNERVWCEYEPSYDGVIIHINSYGAKLFGYKSSDDVIGKKMKELYAHPFDHEKTLSMLFRDGEVAEFFTLMKSRDGNLFFVKQSSTLVTEGLYKCPLKVKSELELVQSILPLYQHK